MINKKVNETLAEALADAGLSNGEIKVLVFLLEHANGLRVSDIAKKIRLNRTTIYGTLKMLSERGLISSSEKRGVLLFQSIQPHLLVNYLERVREQLTGNIKKVEELIPTITDARNKEERYRPNIQFFDGTEGIKQVYEDLMRNNKEKLVYGFTGAHALVNLMGTDWAHYVLQNRPALGVKWLAIASESPYAREMAKNDSTQLRETKFLPAIYNFDIEFGAYDEKTIIISFSQDYPWAMIINDKPIADTVKAIFKYVNDTLPK